MHRFYLPPAQCQDALLLLSARDAHHALHVLRLQCDERVTVLDGAGHELHCLVAGVDRHAVTLRVLQRLVVPPLPYQVTLLQAVTKGKAMELIVQKATELGAHRIVPLLAKRSPVQLEAERTAQKQASWQTTAIEAIKQCGSAWLPLVEMPLSLKQFLDRGERFDLPLLACLQSGSRHPRDVFKAYQSESGGAPKTIAVWIGPEGDFTPAEMSAVQAAGAWPISLGKLILRSETAAIYCLSVLNYELHS